jgi:hypothetical protein
MKTIQHIKLLLMQSLFRISLKRFKITAGLRYDYFDLINYKNYFSPSVSLISSNYSYAQH